MKLIEQSVELLTNIDEKEVLQTLERYARTCYQSSERITEDSYKQFMKMILNRGHLGVLEHFLITFKIITNRGCCYSKDTQVLTNEGWKFFKDLNGSELFLSKTDDNNLEYVAANKIIKKKFNDYLLNFKSSELDLLVTPNHNMWVFDYNKRSKKTKTWKFLQADNLKNSRYMFDRGGINNQIHIDKIIIPASPTKQHPHYLTAQQIEFNSLDFFKFLGLWLTDGSISDSNNGSGDRLIISQIKPKVREVIKNLLLKMNLSFSENEKEFRINKMSLKRFLQKEFLPNNNQKSLTLKLPRWVLEQSKENLQALLDGIILGDGYKDKNRCLIYTSSLSFAEDLVEIALKLNRGASIREYRKEGHIRFWGNGKKSICKSAYVVNIKLPITLLDKRTAQIGKMLLYDDDIFCVELEKYHRLFVMRNGKSCWCGNSHELVRHRIASYLQESTRYVKYDNIEFIRPVWNATKDEWEEWVSACLESERHYQKLIQLGWKPEQARDVLNNALKTEIVTTMNIREWKYFLSLRTSKAAHPQMRDIASKIEAILKEKLPTIFGETNEN